MATYVIPDIHGCLRTLKYLFEDKLKISMGDRVFMLGDYIDRGPDSYGVVDYIIRLIETGYNINCIKGNHEQLLLDSVGSIMYYNLWMVNAGEDTLKSYSKISGIGYDEGDLTCITEKHMEFYRSLPTYLIVDDKYVMVHGGLDFRLKDPFSDEKSMLWKRPEQIPDSLAPGKRIFHGHTPAPLDYIMSRVNVPDVRLIGLDAGCVYKSKVTGFGFLTAFNIDKWELLWVENQEG